MMNKIKALVIAAILCLTAFGGVTTVYAADAGDVQAAIDAAAEGTVVRLTDDCAESLTVAADTRITLDLAGHALTETLENAGALTLTDSVGTGALRVSGRADTVRGVVNKGTLTLDGARIECTASDAAVVHAVSNESGATLTVADGAIEGTATGTGFVFGIHNQAGATTTVTGGSVTARVTATTSAGNAIAINNLGTIQAITGGTLQAEAYGTSKETTAIRSNGRIESIAGGMLRGYVKNGGAISFGLFNQANGTIESITDGEIIGETDANDYTFGLRNLGVVTEIGGGVIRAVMNNTATTLSPNAVAVCNDKTIGSITGGTFYSHSVTPKGGTIGIRTRGASSTIGSLTGGAVRLSKPAAANYFLNEGGGTTTYGEGYALSDAQSSGYRYVLGAGQTVEEAFLGDDTVMTGTVSMDGETVKTYVLAGTVKNDAAEVGGAQYASIGDAIAAAADGETVTVLKDAKDGFTVGSGKNVTVDLNGFTVSGTVTNRGTLAIVDGTGKGRLYKTTAASGQDPLVRNYGALDFAADGLICGTGNASEAHGIVNEAGGRLRFDGRLRAVAYGTCFGHGIVSAGDVEIVGGSVEAVSLHAQTTANIVALSAAGGSVTVGGGRLYAQTAGKAGAAIGIRAQNAAQITAIAGGDIKAVTDSVDKGNAAVYGIYLEGAASAAAMTGGTVTAVSYTDFAFGIFNKGNLTVSGGRIESQVRHELDGKAPNAIGISNEGTATIGGGYVRGSSTHGAGGAYGVRNRGSLTVSGGVFAFDHANGAYVLDSDKQAVYTDGVTLREMAAAHTGYAAADGDIIVEQLDGTLPIGADVFRDGAALYAWHSYDKAGYRLKAFETAEGMAVKDFAAITESTTVHAVYDKAPVYLFLGSSVTYGHANDGSSFVNVIADRLDCVCVKEAVSGTTLANNGGNSYVARMQAKLDAGMTVDRLIVQLSTNDASQNVPRGKIADSKNIEDFDDTTTLGAIETIIAYARSVWGCEVTFYTNPPYENAAYKTLVDDLYRIADKWGIDIVDFYRYKDMDALDAATLNSFMADAIHPNAQGYRWMGEVFAAYLQKA